jgi:hypothetical protein
MPALLFLAAPAAALDSWGWPDLGQPDKQGHAAVGVVVGAVASLGADLVVRRPTWWTRALVGIAAAAVVGAAKEVADAHLPHHDPDPKDAIATVAGGTVGALSISLAWRF